jgi:hypothetical protein
MVWKNTKKQKGGNNNLTEISFNNIKQNNVRPESPIFYNSNSNKTNSNKTIKREKHNVGKVEKRNFGRVSPIKTESINSQKQSISENFQLKRSTFNQPKTGILIEPKLKRPVATRKLINTTNKTTNKNSRRLRK